jgi:hypothetical protein
MKPDNKAITVTVHPHQGTDLPIERSISVLKYGRRIKATINNRTACCQKPIMKRAIVPTLIKAARKKLNISKRYLIPKPIRRAENQLTVKTMYLICIPPKKLPKKSSIVNIFDPQSKINLHIHGIL